MNTVTLIGRLTRDPKRQFDPKTGIQICNFTLAVNRELSKEKKESVKEKGEDTADFIWITVFGKQAENCVNYLFKGSQCAVIGHINTSSYQGKEGAKQYKTGVTANRVEFLGGKKKEQNDDIITLVDGEEIPF